MKINANVRGHEFLDSSPVNEFQNISDLMIFEILTQKNREASLEDVEKLIGLAKRNHIDSHTLCKQTYLKTCQAYNSRLEYTEQKYKRELRYTMLTFLCLGNMIGWLVTSLL